MEHTVATNPKEIRYIKKRCRKAFRESLCFYICRIFPIKSDLISVCTFEGKGGFGCNAKPLVEKLHELHPEYEFVWFVNDMDKVFPDYIKKVPNTLWNRAYWLTRSKVWIDNYRKPLGTKKRSGQYYINTWHASEGFKAIGLLRRDEFSKMAYLVSKSDSEMIDVVTTDSLYLEKMYRKGLLYDGKYLRVGQCRCDVLYGDRDIHKKKFRKKYKLPDDAKIVMFAPTFREQKEGGQRTVYSELWSIDFERMRLNLQRRFGGDWYICTRLHPQLANEIDINKSFPDSSEIIDVSKADDMYEILSAMDAYITDYSSAAFDAGLCRMPVFLYADDIKTFSHDRGGLLWNLSERTNEKVSINENMTPGFHAVLPYPVAKNNDELETNILNFEFSKYENKLQKMEQELEILFDGNASTNTAKWIIDHMDERGSL